MIEGLIPLVIFVMIAILALDIGLIRRRHPWMGWIIGLLLILTVGIGFIIPPLTCKSENPVGCEWAGIGVLIIGGLTIVALAAYSLLAAGFTLAHRRLFRIYPHGIPLWRSYASSFWAFLLLIGVAVMGGFLGMGGFRLVQTGIFVPWRFQGVPPDLQPHPGERAVAFHGYSSGNVQIITNDGRVFVTSLDYCAVENRKSQNCWWYGSDKPVSNPAPQADPSCRIDFWIPRPPGRLVEYGETSSCMPSYMIQTNYALLEDGSVWAWHHEVYRGDFRVAAWAAAGALAGMLTGIAIAVKLSIRPVSTASSDLGSGRSGGE